MTLVVLACAPAWAQTKLSLAIGATTLNYIPVGLADALGYYKDQGLNVQIENFQAGGSQALQALVGGSVDAVVGSYEQTIHMQAQGKEIVGVVLLNDLSGIVFGVRADLADHVKSGKDLKGLRIGISSPGSGADLMLRYYLARNGLTPRDVSILPVGIGASAVTAITNKAVDGALYWDPIAALLDQRKAVFNLFDARTSQGSATAFGAPGYPYACLYVTRQTIEKKPQAVQALANALIKALYFIRDKSPEQIIDTLPTGWKLPDRALNIETMTAAKHIFSTT